MNSNYVVTLVEVSPADWDEFVVCRERIRKLLAKRLSPDWGFVHTDTDPVLSWDGCQIIKGPE